MRKKAVEPKPRPEYRKKPKVVDPSVLLTKEQVAGMLQMSTRTVYRKAMDGEIPAPIKIGRCIRWRRDIMLAWIENNCAGV